MAKAPPVKFGLILRMMSYIGLTIKDVDKTAKDLWRRRGCYFGIFFVAVSEFFFLKQLVISETLEQAMHTVASLINMSHTWVVLASIIMYRSTYREIIITLSNNFWDDYIDGEESEKILQKSVGLETVLTKSVLGICVVASAAQEILPLTAVELLREGNKTIVQYHVPVDLFTPFNRQDPVQFVFDRICMATVVTSLMYLSVIANCFYNSLLINGASHFELLNTCLSTLVTQDDGDIHSSCETGEESNEELPDLAEGTYGAVDDQTYNLPNTLKGSFHYGRKEIVSGAISPGVNRELGRTTVNPTIQMEEKLSKLIEVHQAILRTVDDMNFVMGPVVFLLYISVTINLCVLIFQAVIALGEDTTTFLMITTQLIFVLLRVGVYCYLGNTLTTQAEETYQIVYGTSWYNFSGRFKSTIYIMMARAQRRVAISSTMVGELSMEAYADILNKTYTYFTILKNMRE